jgi:hypothetical protein
MNMAAKIEAHDVSMTFESSSGPVHALDHLNLKIENGETMAIGRTFKEALQKGLRSLEIGRHGLGSDGKDKIPFPAESPVENTQYLEEVRKKLVTPNARKNFLHSPCTSPGDQGRGNPRVDED